MNDRAAERRRMVAEQIAARGVRDPSLLECFFESLKNSEVRSIEVTGLAVSRIDRYRFQKMPFDRVPVELEDKRVDRERCVCLGGFVVQFDRL